MKLVIEAAAKMGIPYFNTFMGGDASKTIDANWDDVLRVLAGDRRARGRQRREGHDRELPNDLQ